jgi:nicotinamidase-related amidase
MQLGDRDCEPHDHLLRGNGEIVVTKKRVSAFAGSDLAQIFRGYDVDHLVVAGITISGVVLSTM